MSKISERRRRWAALAVGLIATGVFFVNICDLVFDCGCASLWAGGAEHCNIHHAEGPRCPWCANPFTAGAGAFVSVAVAQVWLAVGPLAVGLAARVALTVAALPAVGVAIGWLQGSWYGYWG
ncbi:MAG: hypothetical protein GKS06_14835 [Acidobacteria bacterium]|nr:hypothetical protein [Acidobacteriota bacterium]